MKHRQAAKTFHRERGQRLALVQSLINNLILEGKITTTTSRAKYIKRLVEPLVTTAKKQNLATLRLLLERLPKKSAYKLYYEVSPRFKDRAGGYTRVTKLPILRRNDAAEMSQLSFVE